MAGPKLPMHPRNAPGPFYVVADCCTLCGVPVHYAPELFEQDDRRCWVKQQPVTRAEHEQMLDVIRIADTQCIRYAGHERSIIARLILMNEAEVADAL